MALRKKAYENIVRSGENACEQHFLLFPQYLLIYKRQISTLDQKSNCRLQTLLKCCPFVTGQNKG